MEKPKPWTGAGFDTAEIFWINIENTYRWQWNTARVDDTTGQIAGGKTGKALEQAEQARDRLAEMTTEFLRRYPNDSHKWEAMKYQVEATRDGEQRKILLTRLITPDTPTDIRQWAKWQFLETYVVGKGTGGEAEVAAFCKEFPEDTADCERLRLSSASWYLLAKLPDRAKPSLEDLFQNGHGYIRDDAKKMLDTIEQAKTK